MHPRHCILSFGRFITLVLLFALAIGPRYALAVDSYRTDSGELTIPYVQVGDTIYRDVTITIGNVISINDGKVQDNFFDTFDSTTGQLFIPNVTAYGANYKNVVITVGKVISAGGTLPAIGKDINSFLYSYLNSHGITASTLAVMKNGQLIYEAAFGYQNANQSTALPPSALMTGASIVKPVTAAGIQRLATAGKLDLNDKVFCPAGITPSNATNNSAHCWISRSLVASTDPNIGLITISQLIAHEGGWDRAGTGCYPYQAASAQVKAILTSYGNPCDIIQLEAVIQGIVGSVSGSTPIPPTLTNDIQVFMNANLDFTPGGAPAAGGDRYSNFGYMLLGHILEQASGIEYNEFINTKVLAPIGVNSADFQTNNPLLVNANAREPNYITSRTSYSVYTPGVIVNARDGVVNTDNFKACATSMMTAKAMATFAQYYKIDAPYGIDGPNNGVPLNGTTNTAYHRGDLPGTAAIVRQLSNGISYAVLMNKNDRYENPNPTDYQTEIMHGIDLAISRNAL